MSRLENGLAQNQEESIENRTEVDLSPEGRVPIAPEISAKINEARKELNKKRSAAVLYYTGGLTF